MRQGQFLIFSHMYTGHKNSKHGKISGIQTSQIEEKTHKLQAIFKLSCSFCATFLREPTNSTNWHLSRWRLPLRRKLATDDGQCWIKAEANDLLDGLSFNPALADRWLRHSLWVSISMALSGLRGLLVLCYCVVMSGTACRKSLLMWCVFQWIVRDESRDVSTLCERYYL